MFSAEIDQKSMAELWELRRRHNQAARELVERGDTALTRMVAFVTTEFGEAWENSAPRLTGTLASATRERVRNEEGRVFIDPTIENPILGGLPSIYGPIVHNRNPWVQTIFRDETPRIVSQAANRFFDELDRIYAK